MGPYNITLLIENYKYVIICLVYDKVKVSHLTKRKWKRRFPIWTCWHGPSGLYKKQTLPPTKAHKKNLEKRLLPLFHDMMQHENVSAELIDVHSLYQTWFNWIVYGAQLSWFTYHMWIGGFLTCAAAHTAIFRVRDYDPTAWYNDLLDHVIRYRDAIISHA